MSFDTAIRCFKANITMIQNEHGHPPQQSAPWEARVAWNLNTGLVNLAESLARMESAQQRQK